MAGDLLAKSPDADEVRAVYTSESFPPLCFGVSHALKPDLAAKLKAALTGFKIDGTSVAKALPGRTKFAAVDYKQNWAFVRQIDDSLGRLLDAK